MPGVIVPSETVTVMAGGENFILEITTIFTSESCTVVVSGSMNPYISPIVQSDQAKLVIIQIGTMKRLRISPSTQSLPNHLFATLSL